MRRATPYLFLSPAIALFAAFILVPIGYTAYLSLRRVQVEGLGLGADARREVFAGLQNFRDALGDAEFGASLLRVLGYGAVVVPVMLGLALLFALLLDSTVVRFARFSRIAIFLPYALPGVIAGLILAFAKALGEFGATPTFAGSLQGVTRTLPLEIYLQRETDADAAVALSLLLIVVAAAIVIASASRRLAGPL